MINQMNQNENTQNQFSNAFRELQIGKLLRKIQHYQILRCFSSW